MNDLNLEQINSIVNSPSVYLILFIFLLGYVLKSSQIREFKMRDQLDKIVPILDNLVSKVSSLEEEMRKGNRR